MKKLIIIAALLLLAGCKSDSQKPENQGPKNIRGGKSAIITCIPVVDGCWFEGHRYIVAYSSVGCAIIHAANCPCGRAK